MATPVEGSTFANGEIRVLTFVLGFNLTPLTTRSGKFTNISTNNSTTFNNTDITVADNGTGTITVTANLNLAGNYVAQFHANNATLKSSSPVFTFKVQNPI